MRSIPIGIRLWRLFIFLAVIPLALSAGRCRSAVGYTLQGKVVMTNNCNGGAGVLPARVKVRVELFFTSGETPGGDRDTFDTPVTSTNTREGNFILSVTTNLEPSHWTIEVLDESDTPICIRLSCNAPSICRDTAGHVRRITVAGTTTDHTEEFRCSCTES